MSLRIRRTLACCRLEFFLACTSILASILVVRQPLRAEPREYLVYVGTYTDHGSKGIYAFRFDAAEGKFTPLGLAAESAEPTFLALASNQDFLYAINETRNYNGQPTGAVSAFAIEAESGGLRLLNQVSSRDEGPAHITLDRTGKYAIVSNYTLGSVAVFPVFPDGHVGDATSFVQHKGSSANPERQKGPHAHAAAFSPDNRFVIVADLGLDELLVYPFDAAKGSLGVAQSIKTKPGAGPRHLVFGINGEFLYVVNEMESTVVTYSYDPATGALRELQSLSTLPSKFSGENTAGEIQIHPSGKYVFASNRGDDSVAVFSVDHKTGKLKLVEIDSTRGKTPRNFALDPSGSWLVAADQDSDQLVVFRVDASTGHLTVTGEPIHVLSPACVQFVEGQQDIHRN